jgi:MSHA biogenesis protein MshQ
MLAALLFFSPLGVAATYLLPASIGVKGTPFKDCSGAGPSYTCTRKIDIKGGNTVVLSADVTLNVNAEFKVSPGGSVDNSGFIFDVNAIKIHIDGTGTVVMDNLTASGDVIIHKQANLTANVVSTGGDIAIGDGGATVNGNIDAQNGGVSIAGGNNTINGNVSASGGAGPLTIDATSIVSGTCNPDHPQCNGGPGGGTGPVCTTTQIAADGEEFRAISGSSDSNIIAVGKNGGLYQYDGTTWTKNTFVSPQDLNDVETVAANLAYAVGKKGKVLKFDGTNWTTLPKPTNEDLLGVWADASGEIWVVGKKNALYRWNGASWQDMSGGGQANVDNNQELREAWGDGSVFYALEKDGDLYRYSRPGGPWSKRTACSTAFNLDVRDVWGDGTGNVYIAGKDKGAKPAEAAIFLYNEGSDSCSKLFGTATQNELDGIYGNAGTIYAVGKGGLVVDNTSGSFTESIVGGQDYRDVWVSGTNTAYYAGKKGFLTTCNPVTELDHFVIAPAAFAASTCLPNAVTITAEDAGNNTLTGYTGTVSITTSRNHGNWSKNTANGVLSPDPDNDDDGAVAYSFDALDAGVVVLDLSNTHAETLTISISEGAVTTVSSNVNFGDNVFVVSEDPVQVAGRPLSMNIAMWRNDRGGANCAIDTNYNDSAQSLDVSIDRNGVLTAANNPAIGGTAIVDSASTPIIFDFQSVPGQTNFSLDNSDVGQYRLLVTDNTLAHSDIPIQGTSAVMTLRPFGIAVSNLRDTLTATPNPMNAAPGGAIFTTAGHDLSATVSGVLWDAADDSDNNGVLDTGVYADNAPAPSFAWNTNLAVSLAPTSYTPSPGSPGSLNNSNIAQLAFAGGSAAVGNLQYTEVGSFTLQAAASNYLGEPTADIVGDDIVVGRFIPANFEVTVVDDGALADTCSVFTYIGEDFGYGSAPRINVTAVNSLGDTTAQYRDAFVKLGSSSVTVVATRDETTTGTDAVLLDVSYSPAVMAFAPQNNGIVSYTFGADTYRYGPDAPLGAFSKNGNSQVAPFSADIDPEITAISDVEVTSNYAAGTYRLNPVGNNLRFGRLRMDNVYGSELNPLAMAVLTEFWSGFSFQKNNLDTCSTIAAANLASVASPPGLSVPSVVNAPALAGDINYSYPAPGAGNVGYVDTTTDLSAAAQLWLRYDWDADGEFDNDPSARATFGIFEGNPVQIYMRQVYE